MKKDVRLFLALSVVTVMASVSFGQSPYVHNKFIPMPCCGTGLLPFAEIELLENMDELNTYMTQNGCTAAELSELPDFDAEVAFGVVTGYCSDHHTSYSRGVEGAVFCSDTFTLLLHGGVSVDSTQVLPLGFCTMLVTADKNKLTLNATGPLAAMPLAIKGAESITSVKSGKPALLVRGFNRQSAMGSWDILGRSFENRLMHTNGMIIRRNEDGRIIRTFAGGLHPSAR